VKRLASSILAAALLAGLSLTVGCGNKPSEEDCDKLVRHIIDLEAAEAGGGALPADQRGELEQRKKTVLKSVGTKYCRDDMPMEQVRCALEAKNLAELASKCDRS
jgi:hypothetical protein